MITLTSRTVTTHAIAISEGQGKMIHNPWERLGDTRLRLHQVSSTSPHASQLLPRGAPGYDMMCLAHQTLGTQIDGLRLEGDHLTLGSSEPYQLHCEHDDQLRNLILMGLHENIRTDFMMARPTSRELRLGIHALLGRSGHHQLSLDNERGWALIRALEMLGQLLWNQRQRQNNWRYAHNTELHAAITLITEIISGEELALEMALNSGIHINETINNANRTSDHNAQQMILAQKALSLPERWSRDEDGIRMRMGPVALIEHSISDALSALWIPAIDPSLRLIGELRKPERDQREIDRLNSQWNNVGPPQVRWPDPQGLGAVPC